MRITDVREITQPIASPIRNAYIDFSKMTASLVGKRPLSTAPQAAFGVASRLALQFQGSSSSRRLGSWVRMRPRTSVR